jgi:hypothetical protein
MLRVLILPTISGERIQRKPALEKSTLGAFSQALAEAAGDVFAWRRWIIAGSEEVIHAGAVRRKNGALCRDEACAAEIASSMGATHVLFSRLTKMRDKSCAAYVSLISSLASDAGRVLKDEIAPCSADNVLQSAIDLGRRIAEGPRAPIPVALSLTPLDVPTLDIPDIPDVSDYATTTSTRTRRIPLKRALEIYKTKHMFVFDDDRSSGAYYVVRDGKIINDCDVRRAASAPITSDTLEFCEGNSWEWAWAGFPAGAIIAAVGANDLNNGGVFAFAFGIAVAVTSAAIAVIFNRDAVDVEDGTHLASREEIERLVEKSNERFREALDLTNADVVVAGMRK